VVDEVGYLPIDSREAYLFFQFVSYRYEKNSTIITSNKSFDDWQELFGDPVIATAILDRLLHHCRVFNIKGHSYRLRKHQIHKTDATKTVPLDPTAGSPARGYFMVPPDRLPCFSGNKNLGGWYTFIFRKMVHF
jgi:hypothetical protein